MKILCVSDHVDPLVYTPTIKERFRDVSLVLSAGDLPMEYLGFISSSINTPVVFVFGNHNLRKLTLFDRKMSLVSDIVSLRPALENYYGATHVGDRVNRVRGVLIAGLGGSMRYNGGENQFTDFEMWLKAIKLMPRLLWNRLRHGRYLDILLTHASPYGIHDLPDKCHIGFKAFLWFMRVFKPRFLIHGHIHLYDLNAVRRTRYHETEVLNVYNHQVIELDTGESIK